MTDKDRSKSLQSRLGFDDPELKTPKHDAIMLWLDKEAERIISDFLAEERDSLISELQIEAATMVNAKIQAIEKFIQKRQSEAFSRQEKMREQSISASRAFLGDFLKKEQQEIIVATQVLVKLKEWLGLGTVPQWPNFSIIKTWGKPVVNKATSSKYIVGFVDMCIEGQFPYLTFMGRGEWDDNLNPRIFILDNSNITAEMIATSFIPQWGFHTLSREFYFEVKPTIRSVGELIRQIRTYQQYQTGEYFVVSPDDRFADILKDQGIHFVKCPD